MAKKDREYDEILKGCKEAEDAISLLKTAARALSAGADSAAATLQDRVGKQDVDSVKDLAETITKVTATGEERIRELQQSVARDKADFEDLIR